MGFHDLNTLQLQISLMQHSDKVSRLSQKSWPSGGGTPRVAGRPAKGPEGTLLVTELCRATGAVPSTATLRSPFFEPQTASVLLASFPFPCQPLQSFRKLKKCSPSLWMGLLSADSTAPVSISVLKVLAFQGTVEKQAQWRETLRQQLLTR